MLQLRVVGETKLEKATAGQTAGSKPALKGKAAPPH